MPLLQRAAALQQAVGIRLTLSITSGTDKVTRVKVLPGHGGHHHARRQLSVVLGAYDVTAVVTQRDVGRLGIQGARVCGRHRDDAQVPDVSEGGVQVVYRRPERIQVAKRSERVTPEASLSFSSAELQKNKLGPPGSNPHRATVPARDWFDISLIFKKCHSGKR